MDDARNPKVRTASGLRRLSTAVPPSQLSQRLKDLEYDLSADRYGTVTDTEAALSTETLDRDSPRSVPTGGTQSQSTKDGTSCTFPTDDTTLTTTRGTVSGTTVTEDDKYKRSGMGVHVRVPSAGATTRPSVLPSHLPRMSSLTARNFQPNMMASVPQASPAPCYHPIPWMTVPTAHGDMKQGSCNRTRQRSTTATSGNSEDSSSPTSDTSISTTFTFTSGGSTSKSTKPSMSSEKQTSPKESQAPVPQEASSPSNQQTPSSCPKRPGNASIPSNPPNPSNQRGPSATQRLTESPKQSTDAKQGDRRCQAKPTPATMKRAKCRSAVTVSSHSSRRTPLRFFSEKWKKDTPSTEKEHQPARSSSTRQPPLYCIPESILEQLRAQIDQLSTIPQLLATPYADPSPRNAGAHKQSKQARPDLTPAGRELFAGYQAYRHTKLTSSPQARPGSTGVKRMQIVQHDMGCRSTPSPQTTEDSYLGNSTSSTIRPLLMNDKQPLHPSDSSNFLVFTCVVLNVILLGTFIGIIAGYFINIEPSVNVNAEYYP
ncbi:mucin-1-like [Ornithodoros turicata]|uniref:mucin-1-like n=1 Tax=Ornithodoros turicata TaxID=34597 RepID=UPI0031391E58